MDSSLHLKILFSSNLASSNWRWYYTDCSFKVFSCDNNTNNQLSSINYEWSNKIQPDEHEDRLCTERVACCRDFLNFSYFRRIYSIKWTGWAYESCPYIVLSIHSTLWVHHEDQTALFRRRPPTCTICPLWLKKFQFALRRVSEAVAHPSRAKLYRKHNAGCPDP